MSITAIRGLSDDELDRVSGALPQYGYAVPGSPGLAYCPGGTAEGNPGTYGINATCLPTLEQQAVTIINGILGKLK